MYLNSEAITVPIIIELVSYMSLLFITALTWPRSSATQFLDGNLQSVTTRTIYDDDYHSYPADCDVLQIDMILLYSPTVTRTTNAYTCSHGSHSPMAAAF